jgi:hypothetical protein
LEDAEGREERMVRREEDGEWSRGEDGVEERRAGRRSSWSRGGRSGGRGARVEERKEEEDEKVEERMEERRRR